MTQHTRIILTVAITAASLGITAGTFWYQDWRYSLPTPRPPSLTQIAVGSALRLPAALKASAGEAGSKPLFLHFFNPACPCSRFNLDHVRMLARRYGARIRFVAVLQGGDAEDLMAGFKACRLPMEAVADSTGAIAQACGVYATPQAVLLDGHGKLFYRGNYNTARYCSRPSTEFARIALDSLLGGEKTPAFPQSARRAYGCPLPGPSEKDRPVGKIGAAVTRFPRAGGKREADL